MVMTRVVPTTPKLIAPCGINCRLCLAYGREKDACPGCRVDDPSKRKTCVQCKIKNCAKLAASKAGYCFDCDEFPCERVKHLDKRYRTKYGTSTIENLLSIKTIGVRNFVKNENKKWTCPQCGAMLCMHRPQCRACGYVWNKQTA